MALRDLIAAIPHVGGSIEAIVPEPTSKAAERRLQFMFAELHREMRLLDGSTIREDVLETEEWADLVRRAVARSVQIRDCKRLSAIARVLAARATRTATPSGHAQPPDTRHGDVLLAMLG